jgi:hypothetical protein
VCAKEFEPALPKQAVCSVVCAKRIPRINRKADQARDKARREAIKPRSKWLAEAQSAFNAWIRARDDHLPCISCGAVMGKMNAGHYLPTTNQATRFDDRNVHKQCERCNTYLSGNLLAYRAALIQRIGQEQVDLLEMPREHHKWTVADLRAIKEDYRSRLASRKP